ncbi:ATP-binding protein [Glycomyces harbinensis]|uniref:ATP-binding protein n=1 Tax=Glycomyces harbinensis TaxID=58114 RepID=UPI0024DE2091|nr:LuxR C-terminal-related transcriptional regulator [Glycomyces harbinensis]
MRGGTESLWPGARFNLTRFVGREAEIKAVARLLRDTRLVSLVGAPGAGKTRLAAEVATVAEGSFREGLRPVALAPVADAEDVTTAIAMAFGVRDDGDSRLEDSLVDALRATEVLILLDNCEHVTRRVAKLVSRILAEAPRVRVLTTSRVPLGIAGERLHRVPPLSREEAAELFTDRASMVTDLVLDDTGRAYIDQICARLDRLPLAIELAARQTRALSLRDLLVRLDTELLRVTIPDFGGPTQRTLAGTIAWSCRLLSAEQRRLFERLSVFAGYFDIRAVETVAGRDPLPLTDLTVLVDHSLLLADPAESGTLRYRMLEPIRQYAAALLDEHGDGDEVRRRHADHYLECSREAARGLMRVDGRRWSDELRRAEGNMLAAINWARHQCSDLALQLVTSMAAYWEQRGNVNEARGRVEALIDHGPSTHHARAEALLVLSQFGYRQGRYAEAMLHADEAVDLMCGLGDDDGVARGLRALSLAAGAGANTAAAIEAGERSVAIFQALGDRLAEAWSHTVLAFAYFSADDIDGGAESDAAALRLLETGAESPVLTYRIHIGLSYAAYRRHDTAGHRRHLAASIIALRQAGALDGDVEWMWSGLTLAHEEGRMASVLRLTGAARALVRRGYIPPRVVDGIWRRAVGAAENRVGPQAAERLLADGAAMAIEEAVTEATATPGTQAAPLSERELEVARLTGQGLNNAEIADRLFISRRTVETHQEHIREKLHLSSRYEVMAWALAEESV